jgi:hypothetical protein
MSKEKLKECDLCKKMTAEWTEFNRKIIVCES